MCSSDLPGAGEPDAALDQHAAYSRREIEFLAATESVVHLTDLVLRRTSMAFRGELSLALLDELAGVLAPVLGWDAARAALEVELTVALLRDLHGVELESVGTASASPA